MDVLFRGSLRATRIISFLPMSSLRIFAGPDALARLRDEGLCESQFRVMTGASGGPKWFVLYGLDRYLFGEFFAGRQDELYTLGSSAGAWRLCCLATADPVAAIERLAYLYSHEEYSAKPTVSEITDKARVLLQTVLGPTGAREIAQNAVFRTHIVAARARGLGSSSNTALQGLALGSAALANVASRRLLSLFFERTLFANTGTLAPWQNLRDLPTQTVRLTESNVFMAMMASGSIPFALAGERHIDGAAPGLYVDGGITDYHFDVPLHRGDELVLYPHFSTTVVPGWFDKHLAWRRPSIANYRNVVLVTPSPEFVAALPYGKIPDRSDFKTLEFPARLDYWQQVLDRSQQLAEDFATLVSHTGGLANVEPLPFSQRR